MTGPRRVLLLDTRPPARWILATYHDADTTPAAMNGPRYSGPSWLQACAWVRGQLGRDHVRLVPLTSSAWAVTEETQR